MSLPFPVDWVDAFTDTAFGGNGCAVVHGGATLSPEVCMAFVRETSLVECTFTGPSKVANVRIRYYLASREIPFAGHPTIATLFAMYEAGLIGDGDWTIETDAGVMPVSINEGQVSMTQNAPDFGAKADPAIVAEAFGLQATDIVGAPQVVSTGLPFCITVLKTREALDRAVLDLDKLKAYYKSLGVAETDIMEPFLVTLGGATDAGQTYSRLLLAPPSPAEDPFTGSATGAMAAYLWANGLIDSPVFTAEQGHGMGRPGQAQVKVNGPRDAITGVEVSGTGYVLMRGEVMLPD